MAMSLPSNNRRNGKCLWCDICGKVYRSPRILSCFHTFCLGCLSGLVTVSGTFPCPTCGEEITVPAGGVQHFKVNVYITEEELERERNAEAMQMSYCSKHTAFDLSLFCKKCDEPICLKCKATDHDHGPEFTENLSETAAACKRKLSQTKQHLKFNVKKKTKLSAATQDNIKAVEERSRFIEDQIKSQEAIVVSQAKSCSKQALNELAAMKKTTITQLTTYAQTVQESLDTFIRSEQYVSLVMGSNNHAGICLAEKELRKDGAIGKKLETMDKNLPSTTLMVSFHSEDYSLKEEDIKAFIGYPIRIQLPIALASDFVKDVIQPLFQCRATKSGQEVHAVHRDNTKMRIAYGGRAPDYKRKKIIEMTIINNKKVCSEKRLGHKITFDCEGNVSKDIIGEQHIFGNSNPKVKLVHKFEVGQVTVTFNKVTGSAKDSSFFDINAADFPIGIDSNKNETYFIVLSEKRFQNTVNTNTFTRMPPQTNGSSGSEFSNTNTTRQVQMYLRNKSKPVCSYIPPKQPFLPTAVCFCTLVGKEMLLIADMMTDTVHMVDVAQNQLSFVRYLAYGSPCLVRPTSLNSNSSLIRGNKTCFVWIGCQNGWVLKCTPMTLVKEESDSSDDNGSENVHRSDADGYDMTTELLHVENQSHSTCTSGNLTQTLDVGNFSVSSQSQSTSSPISLASQCTLSTLSLKMRFSKP